MIPASAASPTPNRCADFFDAVLNGLKAFYPRMRRGQVRDAARSAYRDTGNDQADYEAMRDAVEAQQRRIENALLNRHRKTRRAALPGNPSPSTPWATTRAQIAQRVARSTHGVEVNGRYRPSTSQASRESRDLQRFIAEGYGQLSPKRRRYRTLELTPKGRALLPAGFEPRAAQPYARRRAGLAAFEAANPRHFPRVAR